MQLPNFEIEDSIKADFQLISGIDEVGRGCLLGPVVAGAVVIKNFEPFLDIGITDSKKLSQKKREELFEFISNSKDIDYAIGMVAEGEIDAINILNATFKAMRIAINKLNTPPDFLLIDGNAFRADGLPIPYRTIIKGDTKSISIAAASIIAKVTRDRFVCKIAEEIHNDYDIKNNKGYASAKHIQAIKNYGYTKFHRKSFKLKEIENQGLIF